MLAGVGALGAAIGLMATSAWLISRAAQQPLVGVLAVAVVAVRALGISRGVLRYIERLASHDVALRGVTVLRERIYRRLAGADPATVAGLRSGDLLARVGADVDALADLIVRSLLPFAVAALTCLASAVLAAAVLSAAGVAVGLGLLVAGVGASWRAAIGARRAEQYAAAARSRMSEEVLALVDGLGELVVAGVAQQRLNRLVRLDTRMTAKLDAAARPAALAAAVSSLATGLGALAALAIGVQAVQSGALSQVMLAVVALTPLAAAEAVAVLPAAAVGLVRSRTAAERVLELLGPDSADTAADHEDEAPAGQSAATADTAGRGRYLTTRRSGPGWWPGCPDSRINSHSGRSHFFMIRPALPSDHADIAELVVASGLFPPEEVGIVESLMADYTARTQALGHACVVDEDDGRLLAVAYYEPVRGTEGTWELLMIGVRQDHQGQGHGRRLMHHVEDDLRARSQRLLLVQTSGVADFRRTRQFYAGLGYAEEARVRDYYEPGDDMILYRLALRPHL